ncbi:hypothetical protein N4R57_15660 [Rhodobacteraceae bacterium D3-12]|nr:hypothetical protein N4R57_15660 [Rhodobacteraceae bacterium D3-12]
MFRTVFLLISLAFVVACTNANDLDKGPVPLGNFSLGHNVVVAPKLTKGPASREADKDQFTKMMQEAVEERFGRYEGDKLYHFGISLEGYVLAQPGIPLVASPKSILILNLTVWDDAAGKKLNPKVEQITVIESFSGGSLVGSGYTQSAEEQMRGLTRNAAKQIQNYLVRQNYKEGWFKPKPGDPAPKPSEPVAAKTTAPEPVAPVIAPEEE